MSSLFVTCPRHLETLLLKELEQLGCCGGTVAFSGVRLPYDNQESIYRINYGSRLASRVLRHLSTFTCLDTKGLYRGVQSIDWRPFFERVRSFAFDATGSHPALRNRHYAALVCKDAICDQLRAALGWRPDVQVQGPDVQLHLFLTKETATLSVDTSGLGLHMRGYRKASTEAPLRENLAAAMLLCVGYTGEEPLCDPCCGSGTILAEAASMARRMPPGFFREHWGFENLPGHDETLWQRVKGDMKAGIRDAFAPIVGIDKNRDAITIAKKNCELLSPCEFLCADFRTVNSVAPHVVVTNPPCNRRMKADLELYRDLGVFLKQRCCGRGMAVLLLGDPQLAKALGLAPRRSRTVLNGGAESTICTYKLLFAGRKPSN